MNEFIKQSWYATYMTPEIGVTKEDIDEIYRTSEMGQIEAFRKRAESPSESDVTLIAKEDDRVVGIIRFVVFDNHIRIHTLYVHPEYTGRGIGTQLWAEALRHVPVDKKIIAYPALHTKSIDWYKKMGFVATGEEVTDPEAMPISRVHLKSIKMVLDRK
jgi:N-acetylglutamate synthase-like GNAT family acetyltransferase